MHKMVGHRSDSFQKTRTLGCLRSLTEVVTFVSCPKACLSAPGSLPFSWKEVMLIDAATDTPTCVYMCAHMYV